MTSNSFQQAVGQYFDTSDRPVDNKTGTIEAIGDHKAGQLAVISHALNSPLGKVTIGTELALGLGRLGIAFHQNNMIGVQYEAGRLSAEMTGTLLGADAALAHDDQSVRITTDANGVTTYEFTAGETEHGLAIAADAVDAENDIHLGADGDADSGAASEDAVQDGVVLAGMDRQCYTCWQGATPATANTGRWRPLILP
jgi:hypothetical protein